MGKIFLTLTVMMLSVFTLCAIPNSKEQIGLDNLMESYTASNDSVIQRMDVITAKMEAVYTQMKSDSEKNWFGFDIDLSNMWVAFWGLVIGIVALGVGIVGTWYGYRGFQESKRSADESKRTADNVMRASLNVLEGQFNDLIRHLYRNLVCILAFSQKTLESASDEAEEEKKKISQYPSEEHLLKLKILSEDALQLEKYNNDPTIYQKMHELKLLFRNYDIEIDTTLMHLKNKDMKLSEIKNDLDTLTYKPLHLIEAIRGITDKIMAQQDGGVNFDASKNVASIMTREHISKMDDWKKTKTALGVFLNLAKIVPPFIKEKEKREKTEKPISKPYDGLRRSRNLLFDNTAINTLSYENDIFTLEDKTKGKNNDYRNQIGEICEKFQEIGEFKNNILNQYDFKNYFLTMLSIDVTIELSKIHMIEIK